MSKDTKKELIDAIDISAMAEVFKSINDEWTKTWCEAFGIVPDTPSAESELQERLSQMYKAISKAMAEFEQQAEADHKLRLDSLEGYLKSQGLILPNDFQEFLSWYYIHYSHIVDQEGYKGITREQIDEFSRELTEKHKARTTSTGTQPKVNDTDIESIIKTIFPTLSDYELNALKGNLLNGVKLNAVYPNYNGKKSTLWHYLKQLRACNIHRHNIADVFSSYVTWTTSTGKQPKKLEYPEIYKKI